MRSPGAWRQHSAVAAGLLCVVLLAGCQTTPAPIFPAISPPIVWPPPPDQPRIRYVGELHGEASLGVKPTGWAAFEEFLAGPRPQGVFVRPSAVAVAGERVFVADTGLGVVHLLELAGRRYAVIQGPPSERFRVPIDLTIGGQQLFVVDRGRAAVDVFDLEGNWRSTHRCPELTAPVAIAWDPAQRRYWLADAATHACFATADLEHVQQQLGQRGSGPGQFNYPTALAVHPLSGLIVADAMNFRIQVFDEAGRPVTAFGHKGDAAGDFARPRAVAADSEGHIYVVDNQFENVQVFDGEGRLLLAFGQGGDRPGEFALPAGITIDAQDRIWIADSYNRRVQVFQYLPEAPTWAE
jgi:DNA-binding beta-propeller fold protein YncE